MNKNIRRLIESLFDDDFNDIIDNNDISQNSKIISDKLTSTDILKPLLDNVEDREENSELRKTLLGRDNLIELSEQSHKVGGLSFNFIRISLYKDNIDSFKKIFDILNEYNVLLRINILEFTLENKTNTVYSIKNLLDFTKYNNIKYIKTFVVRHGRLKDFSGLPNYILNSIEFDWIKYIGSMKEFPDTKYNISLYFRNSCLPVDWSGCPNILQELNFQPELPSMSFTVEDEADSIVNSMGNLKNIPYDLTFERNNMNRDGNLYIGCMLIDPSWKTEVKKEIRKYIGNCLKAQYKNITNLKKKLCYSLKMT